MSQDRSIHYENAVTDSGTRHSKRQGRIRVQAGDKRVPPAKSKPRQRRLVSPPDHSSLCMDCVAWSDERYSVKQLVRTHSRYFPLIVKVTQGYYDNSGMEITTNEVLQVHDCAKQRRVDAVDSFGRNLSIPTDYPLEVTPIDGERAGDSLSLAEALGRLPIKVQVLRMTSHETAKLDLSGQTLLLRSVDDNVFLRANAINGGWIDQTQVLTIPSKFEIEFAVAEGMRGATNVEWTDYTNMFSRTVRHIMFDNIPGYPEILIPGESRRVSEMSEPQYDNMRIIAPGNGNPDVIAAHRVNDDNQYMNIPLEAPPPETVVPSRPETPFSVVDEDELSEMFADVIKEGEKMNNELEVTDVAVEIHTPPPTPPTTPPTEGFGSVKNLLQRFKQEEQMGIDNRGQDSGLPRAIVQPTVQQKPSDVNHQGGNIDNSGFISVVSVESSRERKIIYDDRSAASLKVGRQSSIRTMDDVPEATQSLSVADVAQCMRLLNMEAHVSTFENHQVDGTQLCSFSQKVLCDDFRMNPFNASKLLRFARGWRPKLS